MANILQQHHLDYISVHIEQTYMVNELFTLFEGVCPEDIEGRKIWDVSGEISEWLIFNNFCWKDHEKLIEAQILVLTSDYGIWVGVENTRGEADYYDRVLYPRLIKALYGIDCSEDDIKSLRGK